MALSPTSQVFCATRAPRVFLLKYANAKHPFVLACRVHALPPRDHICGFTHPYGGVRRNALFHRAPVRRLSTSSCFRQRHYNFKLGVCRATLAHSRRVQFLRRREQPSGFHRASLAQRHLHRACGRYPLFALARVWSFRRGARRCQ
jgi:hypothetical protein